MNRLIVSLLALALACSANAQTPRINTVATLPAAPVAGTPISLKLNVNLMGNCETFVAANIVQNGGTLVVYLNFDVTGSCPPKPTPLDVTVPFGNLSAGYYQVNLYELDNLAYLQSYYFTVNANGANGCGNPAPIACGNTLYDINSNGVNKWNDYTLPNGFPFNNLTGPEMIYQFTLAKVSDVTIALSGLNKNLDLFLNSACSNIGLLAYSQNTGNADEKITYPDLPAGTYRIIVDGVAGAVSNYGLSLTCPASICDAPDVAWLAASKIKANSATISSSKPGVAFFQFRWKQAVDTLWNHAQINAASSLPLTGLAPCTKYEFQTRALCQNGWSEWSPTRTFLTDCPCIAPLSNQVYVSDLGTNFAQFTSNLLGANGYSWQYRACGSTTWSAAVTTTLNFYRPTGLTANTCYEYQVGVTCYDNTKSNFTFGGQFTTLRVGIGNDEICGATPLYSFDGPLACQFPTFSTNLSATTSTNPSTSTPCGTASNDVWFKFTMPANGMVDYTTYAGSMTDAVVAFYHASPTCSNPVYVACQNDPPLALMPRGNFMGVPGDVYFIRVWGNGGQQGSFSICLFGLPVCNPAARYEAPTLKIFPVPAHEEVTLGFDLTEAGPVELNVFDVNGKLIRTIHRPAVGAGPQVETVDIADLPNGNYWVKLHTGAAALIGRFLKF